MFAFNTEREWNEIRNYMDNVLENTGVGIKDKFMKNLEGLMGGKCFPLMAISTRDVKYACRVSGAKPGVIEKILDQNSHVAVETLGFWVNVNPSQESSSGVIMLPSGIMYRAPIWQAVEIGDKVKGIAGESHYFPCIDLGQIDELKPKDYIKNVNSVLYIIKDFLKGVELKQTIGIH